MDSTDTSMLPHLIPTPSDPDVMARWDHTRLRRRMLSGQWGPDLESRLLKEIGDTKSKIWGTPKLTSNLLATSCREMSALYLTTPEVRSPKAAPIYGPLADAIQKSGLWSRANDFQAQVLGLREAFWRINVDQLGRVSYRPVWPDLIDATASSERPDQPVSIRELRWRSGWGWCWDVLSIEEPTLPVYRIETWAGEDISLEILGSDYSGESYPYRYSDGVPFLPYTIYHARSLGDRLFNCFDALELVEGTLDLAVQNTQLAHVLKDASWPQRWIRGCSVAGSVASADGKVTEIPTDPAIVLQFVDDPEAKNPQVGQWATSASASDMEAVISSIANRIAIEAGLPPTDIQRMGGNARSGYAIALSNEGKRTAARKFAPIFRPSDEELIGKTAALLNRSVGLGLPEYGYSVIYQDLPLSPDELAARRADVLETLGAGLMSRVQAYMELNPGITRAQAKSDLDEIDAEKITPPKKIAPLDAEQ